MLVLGPDMKGLRYRMKKYEEKKKRAVEKLLRGDVVAGKYIKNKLEYKLYQKIDNDWHLIARFANSDLALGYIDHIEGTFKINIKLPETVWYNNE